MVTVYLKLKATVFSWQEQVTIGSAEVRAVFTSGSGRAAGCMVREGKVVKDCSLRVLRNGKTVYVGVLNSLRRVKEMVKEVCKSSSFLPMFFVHGLQYSYLFPCLHKFYVIEQPSRYILGLCLLLRMFELAWCFSYLVFDLLDSLVCLMAMASHIMQKCSMSTQSKCKFGASMLVAHRNLN